jgi:WD40 repeat protein
MLSVVFSPDAKLLATSADDLSIRIWDPRNGRLLRVIRGNAPMLAFTPGSRRIVSAAGVWDVHSGRLVRTFANRDGTRSLFALSVDGKHQAISDSEGGLFLREIESGKVPIAILTAKRYWVMRFTPNGRNLLAYQVGSGLHRLDANTLDSRALLMPALERDEISEQWDLAVSEDGKWAAFLTFDSTTERRWLHFWDLVARREINRVEFPGGNGIIRMDFSPDGRWLAIFTNYSPIYFYDVPSTRLLFTLHGQRNDPTQSLFKDLAFSPCERRAPSGVCTAWKRILATIGYDFTLRFWELPSGRQMYAELPQAAEVKSLALSPDRRWLAAGDTSGEASVWDFVSGGRTAVLRAESKEVLSLMHLETVAHVAFHPNGRWLSMLAKDQSTYFWDPLRGDQARPPMVADGFVTQVSVTPDGQWMVVNGIGSQILRINLANVAARNQALATNLLSPPAGMPASSMQKAWFEHGFSIVFSDNGKLMAHGTNGPYVGIWDSKDWRKLREIETAFPQARVVALSPDARWLFVADWSEQRMELWDLTSNSAPLVLSGNRGGVNDAKFSPDGKWLAVAAFDSVAVWDVEKAKLLRRFSGSTAYLNSVSFLPCPEPALNGVCPVASPYLFAAGEDAATHIWDFSSGELLARLYSLASASDWLVITPDGLFDGTPGAWRQILWRFRDNLFDVAPVEMFFNEYYRPGLLSELMAGGRPQAPRDIAGVDRRVPHVEVKFPGTPPATPAAERNMTLQVVVRESPPDARHPRGSGARDVRLFRNGALVKHWPRVRSPAAGGNIALEARVAILAGENRFTAYAFNRDNVKSEDAQLIVTGAESLARSPVAHVLAVGVSSYANPEFNLTFAHSDAERFAAAIEFELKRLGKYSAVHTIQLPNENATKQNILTAIESIARTSQPEDSVFLYFSGHGSAAQPRFYFVPHDLGYMGFRDPIAPDGLETIQLHSVSDLDLQRVLEKLDASTIVLVIDACNSGQALEAPELSSSNSNVAKAAQLRRQLFYRGPMNAKGLGQLAYEKGMYVLTGAQSYQAALEVERMGSGLMTYALIFEALTERKAARVSGGQVSLTDWLAYPINQVPKMQKEIMDKGQKANKSISFMDDSKLPLEERGIQRPRLFYRREAESRPPIIAGVKAP